MSNTTKTKRNIITRTRVIPWFVVKATVIASLGGVLFGYDLGVIAGALPQLTSVFALSSKQQESIVGVLYLGGGVGAAVGGFLCDIVGRRRTILLTDVFFVLGAAILSCAQAVNQLYVGRVVVGFAIAVSGIADVSYLHEISPIDWRGSIVSVNEACIALGFLLAFLLGYMYESYTSDGWRAMFGMSGVLAFFQLLGIYTMPESPMWLRKRNREQEAREVLTSIYNGAIPSHLVAQEEYRPAKQVENESTTSIDGGAHDEDIVVVVVHSIRQEEEERLCWCWSMIWKYRRQIVISLFLAVFQQLTGQTTVLSYADEIVDAFQSSSSTLLIGVVKFVVTLLVIWKVESVGRRVLLLSGMAALAIGQFLVAFAFRNSVFDDENTSLSSSSIDTSFVLPGVLLVVCGYSVSFGPLTWLLTSELFPTHVRGRALGGSTVTTYLAAYLVTSTFLSTESIVGGSAVFCLYGVATVLGIVVVFVAVPNTGGKDADKIHAELQDMWGCRRRRDTTGKDGPTIKSMPVVIDTELL